MLLKRDFHRRLLKSPKILSDQYDMTPDSSENLDPVASQIRRLRRALADLICWAGCSPDGPDWATPEAKQRNREMFEAALQAAVECFPEDYHGAAPSPTAPIPFN
jgi:hypothetical protein